MPALQTIAAAAFLSMATLSLAAPQPEVTVGVISPTLGTAIGGALDSWHAGATPAPEARDLGKRLNAPPEYLTISIINQYGAAISTSHANNYGAPTPLGNPGAGVIPNGGVGSFAVPTGWGGNVAIGQGDFAMTGDVSLIEASFVVDPGYSVAAVDVDVSYVNGFSVPITCSCAGDWLVGCNKDLFVTTTLCYGYDGEGACVNPLRGSTTATAPIAWFAPCQGAAYTFPNDSGANLWGNPLCQEGTITCCVGTSCPASVLQH